jgi:Mg2+-importing ATPase
MTSFWNKISDVVLEELKSSREGLSSKEAKKRLAVFGLNRIKPKKSTNVFYLLWSQFKSPLVILLMFAAFLSFALYDKTDGYIILAIVVASGLLGFYQEKGAADAVHKLLQIIEVKARVIRDSTEQEISIEKVVPGDIVLLSAGDIIPGDALLLESKDFFVDEATLTGETYAVEKKEGTLPELTPLGKRSNVVYMGSHAVSGIAKAVIVKTGQESEFGKVAMHLKLRPPETAFEHGIRHFGFFLIEVTSVLVIAIFAFNMFLNRPFLESFLFALALAVGLTPQLLPAIVTINLAKGAKKMAKHKVIVRRLASIENFGSMDVLCSDKTGTLTKGVVELQASLGIDGEHSRKVQEYAFLNAHFQTGYTNPIDQALAASCPFDVNGWKKCDEIPYDFLRKRLTVLLEKEGGRCMIVKGAVAHVLPICTKVETRLGDIESFEAHREHIDHIFTGYSKKGFRLLAVAYKPVGVQTITRDDEKEMVFLGFIVLADPLKEGIVDTIEELKKQGISLKIITGDNHLIAAYAASQINVEHHRVVKGSALNKMSDEALMKKVNEIDIFAEVEPNQKERIILALRKSGRVVGYLGDGINDATALHAADVGISVETGADVAKQVADIVLLQKELSVLKRGVQEGRKTFANTMKYIFMATSANFGNMFSMAGASLFLSFLPLLPKQILLTNLLTDFPEMAIATDNVDKEMVASPVRWDIKFIRRFMVVFGLISSVFDYATFGALLWILKASPEEFRTGWFIESVISASVIVLVIRTRKPFYKSWPSRYLSLGVLGVGVFALFAPGIVGRVFGFVSIPLEFYILLAGILGLYILFVEMAKRWFFKTTS